MLDQKLIVILACPLCRAEVEQRGKEVVCVKCRRKYPIKGGIPIMLTEEAKINEKDK